MSELEPDDGGGPEGEASRDQTPMMPAPGGGSEAPSESAHGQVDTSAGLIDPSTADVLAAAKEGLEQVEELTPDPALIQATRKEVSHLLKVMGIKRVISVDDDYAGNLSDLLSMAHAVATVDPPAPDFAGRFNLDEEPEVWQAEIEDAWSDADEAERATLIARARKQAGRSDPEAQPDASALRELLPGQESVEFLALTPQEWRSQVDHLIADAQALPTLVLFDREMDDSQDAGIRFSEEVFGKDTNNLVYVALLTRTVQPGTEHDAWQEFTKQFRSLKSERFVVVSKSHLGPDPSSFPYSLKLVLMSRPAANLREEVVDALLHGAAQAKEVLEQLHPEDFQKMIFSASKQEGVWEPESLLRVFQILMRSKVRGKIYSSGSLRQDAAEIRRLLAIDEFDGLPATDAAIQTAQAELYEDSEQLNKVHLPIDLGDIFKVGSGEYVLVEQPCDLMVRAGGDRQPDVFDAVLLPIKECPPRNVTDYFQLDFYKEDGLSAWVWLNRPILVPVDALDMTVFNLDGRAVLDLDAKVPADLWPAWEARHKVLVSKYRALREAYGQIEALQAGSKITKEMQNQLMCKLFRSDSASGRRANVKVAQNQIEYGLQRVRRILPLRARALLSRYALHRGRDAFDFALASHRGDSADAGLSA